MTVYPNEQAPVLKLSTLSGDTVNLTDIAKDFDFTLVVFYRGVFFPICQMQLQDIESHYQKLLDANMKVIAVSMDTQDAAFQLSATIASDMG
jgi:peroxiredoxin